MTRTPFLLAAVLTILLHSCSKSSQAPPPPTVNQEAKLTYLDLEVGGSVFNTEIGADVVTLTRVLPFGTTTANVRSVYTAENCTATVKAGDPLSIGKVSITVTNKSSNKKAAFQLDLVTRSFSSIVEKNGLLQTKGNKVVNKNGEAVSFAGNSFFWSNNGWGGEFYYKAPVVSWLALDWESTIVRASMGVDDQGGYLQYKTANMDKVKTVVDAAIEKGIYVIIDWHSHHAENYPDDAVEFFTQMATLYGKYDNVIYEVYNEPLAISWSGTLKPYAEKVITAIRQVDPDNLIVVGTPEWSQRVDLPAADPITISGNIAYTLHFYTVYHKQWLRDRATAALNKGIALFVTEWGPLGYTQTDPEADLWMEWCRTNQISHCAWSVNDKQEEWSIVRPGAAYTGGWTDEQLTESGKLERKYIRSWVK